MVFEDASSPAMTSASQKLHANIINPYEVTSDVMPACVATSFPHSDLYKPHIPRESHLSESSSPETTGYECYAPAFRPFERRSPSTDSGTKSDESIKSDKQHQHQISDPSPAKRNPDAERINVNNNSCKSGVISRSNRPEVETTRKTPPSACKNSHPLKKRMLFGRGSLPPSPEAADQEPAQQSTNETSRSFPGSSDILRQMYAAFGGGMDPQFKYSLDQTRSTGPAIPTKAPSMGPLHPATRSTQGQTSPVHSPESPTAVHEAKAAQAVSSAKAQPENVQEQNLPQEHRRKRHSSSQSSTPPRKSNKLSSLHGDKKTAFHAYKRNGPLPSRVSSEKDSELNNSYDEPALNNRKRRSHDTSPQRHDAPADMSDTIRRRSLSGVKRSRHTSSESGDSAGANQVRVPYVHNPGFPSAMPYPSPFGFNPAAFALPGMGMPFGIPPMPQPNPAGVNPFLMGANSYLANPMLLREMIAAQTNAAAMSSLFPAPTALGGFPLLPGLTMEHMQALQHLQNSSNFLAQGNPPKHPVPASNPRDTMERLADRQLTNEKRRSEPRDRARSPTTPVRVKQSSNSGEQLHRPPPIEDQGRIPPFLNKPSVSKGAIPKARSERKKSDKKTERTKNKTTEPRKSKVIDTSVPTKKVLIEKEQPHPITEQDFDDSTLGETSSLDGVSGCPKSASYKNLTRERRLVANARERTRVHTISSAFDELRTQVPSYSCNQKLSKLAILRIACSYIRTLSVLAGRDETTPFSQGVDQCTRVLQAESRARSRRKSNKAQIEWEMVNYERQKSSDDSPNKQFEDSNCASDDVMMSDVTSEKATEVDVETVDERIDVLEDVTNRTSISDHGTVKHTTVPETCASEERSSEHVTSTPSRVPDVSAQ
uniref:Protein atonal homolog 8 n=1 Tax=Phallusia mammillata TaxID=59560 RepID=A0A6F9DIW2_9ASCI|nr:uncharacterized protein LOC778686 [Phallusia mammillata]